ncbi:MAG TPA: S1/P1 nuclease [Candidatus Limnocylindria bacterium]|nr:S1/P1 nuclease [Candidatus Limnocylindria bacterium]
MLRPLLIALVLLPLTALGWGKEGHEIVARIAYENLSPATRIKVTQLLSDTPGIVGPEPMESAATWPDEIRSTPQLPIIIFTNLNVRNAAGTFSLHYADVSGEHFNPETDSDHGKSVVSGIQRCGEVLRSTNSTPAERREALKFLIHFVGDAHQPLHAGRQTDRGGNDIHIAQFLNRKPAKGFNLHEVWDNLLIQSRDRDPARYAEVLNANLNRKKHPSSWSNLDPQSWIEESHKLAMTRAYLDENDQVITNGAVLGPLYVKDNVPVVELQLIKAGYRLSVLLNQLVK